MIRAEEPVQRGYALGRSAHRYDVIVLPDMSATAMMDGFGVGVVPGQYAGGIGQDGLEQSARVCSVRRAR